MMQPLRAHHLWFRFDLSIRDRHNYTLVVTIIDPLMILVPALRKEAGVIGFFVSHVRSSLDQRSWSHMQNPSSPSQQQQPNESMWRSFCSAALRTVSCGRSGVISQTQSLVQQSPCYLKGRGIETEYIRNVCVSYSAV